jgi:tRNA pseudouridine32 synthase/23S rRNA pseudouridine746 synthase
MCSFSGKLLLQTLFENEDILAVNKPEGLASIPERDREKTSLLQWLAGAYPEKLYVVHRLDKEVSGVILFAKHSLAHRSLNQQFAQREVRKTYLGLTYGEIRESCGVIDAPLRQFGSGRAGVDRQRGKPSVTEFQVLERWGTCMLIELHPLTGRRHQIRAHCYSLGHPILGDRRYGTKELQRKFPRLMLHAQEIAFRLLSGEKMMIEAPIPDSFQKVIEQLRHTPIQRMK